MTRPSRFTPAKPSPWFETKTRCSECDKYRATGNHTKCSQIRQARFAKGATA